MYYYMYKNLHTCTFTEMEKSDIRKSYHGRLCTGHSSLDTMLLIYSSLIIFNISCASLEKKTKKVLQLDCIRLSL